MSIANVHCDGKTTRDINREIKQRIAEGNTEIHVIQPTARHNLGVAIVQPVSIIFDGSVGYYCAGMIDGATVEVRGAAGWGLAEGMMNGEVIVEGNAGNGAAAAIRGGAVVVKGNAGARAGVSMKGGTLLIGGNCGYMTGFMAQKGTIVVCGNAGEALADSMYEGVVYVGGAIANLGNDAVVEDLSEEDVRCLETTLQLYLADQITNRKSKIENFKKVVAGRKLWNFDKSDVIWREAL